MEQAIPDPDPAVASARACEAAFYVGARALVAKGWWLDARCDGLIVGLRSCDLTSA